MATRPAPRPRPKFKTDVKCGWFRLENPHDREEYNKLQTLARRGLVRIVYETLPPLMDSKGFGRIFLRYEMDIEMSAAEVAESKQKEIDELNKQLNDGTYTGRYQDSRVISGIVLTAEEQELLRDCKGDAGIEPDAET